MKLLDRYLFRQFFGNLLLVLGALMAIYLLVDFFERIDSFLAAGLGMGPAIHYFLLKTPLIFEQLMPVGLLLAGIITLGLLNRHHEMMALLAAGLSTRRIIRPLLLAAGGFTLLTLALSQWLLPPTLAETNRIWHKEVHKQTPRGIERGGRVYYRGEAGIYSFISPGEIPTSEGELALHDFSYVVWSRELEPVRVLSAAKAVWDGQAWTLHGGLDKSIVADENEFQSSFFNQQTVELPEKPEEFFLAPYALTERSLSTLFNQAYAAGDTPRRDNARLELHKKISYIFLGLPLLLVGMPLLLALHRGRGRDLALAIPATCILAFITWGLWSIGQALAGANLLAPAPASWLIHLPATALGWYFIRKHD